MRALEAAEALADYPRVVLSYRDANGYPRSLRCAVRLDPAGDALVVELEGPLDVERAPASLLAHRHDEALWNQTSVLVRGRIEVRRGDVVFVPTQLVPGIRQGLVPFLRFLVDSRRRAATYLRARGLARPAVPWDRIAELRDRVLGRP